MPYNISMSFIAWLILFFLFGAAFGSFLNVVIDRVPAGLSLICPPSHCSACKKRLATVDLVPIISYLWLRGRCRYCEAKIGWRSFWVETGTALVFALLFWNYGLSWNTAIAIAFGCIFIVLIVTDLEQGILPDKIVYTGIILAIAISAAISFAPALKADISGIIMPAINSALLGGVIGFLFLLIVALIFKGGMGGGDIKLAGLIGLITGFPTIFVAIWLATVSGGIVAIIFLLLKIRERKQTIPFGPFLCLAAIATLLWGHDMLNWYLHIAGFTPL